jgi:hypothetical protein
MSLEAGITIEMLRRIVRVGVLEEAEVGMAGPATARQGRIPESLPASAGRDASIHAWMTLRQCGFAVGTYSAAVLRSRS